MERKFDLEQRTEKFAVNVRVYLKSIEKNIINWDDVKQVIRSPGSIGANYVEANDGFSDKDFEYRIKICRKEAKETSCWLRVILVHDEEQVRIKELEKEAVELTNIFGAILRNYRSKRVLK